MSSFDDERFSVFYWDDEGNELEDIRDEDATLGHCVEMLSEWNMRFQGLRPLTVHYDMIYAKVARVTVEVRHVEEK